MDMHSKREMRYLPKNLEELLLIEEDINIHIDMEEVKDNE